MRFVAEVVVQPKPVVNDPQGLVVRDGLQRLGFTGVHGVRVGKHLELELEAGSESECRDTVAAMCEKLLRNPVIEDYRLTAVRTAAGTAA